MENNETKNSIVRMFGKVPEAMLIINNSIYCDEETDGLFHHEMGITDSLFSTERINEYIIRRPYPNKQVCQVSKKIGRNVFKAGYPVLYNDVSELNGRKYLAFDAWVGYDVPPKDLTTAPDACHIYIPLDIHATKEKPYVLFRFKFLQTAVLPDDVDSTDEFALPTQFEFGFYVETYEIGENGYIYPTRWETRKHTMSCHAPDDKLLALDESLTDKEHNVYVYHPIDVSGSAFNNTDFLHF